MRSTTQQMALELEQAGTADRCANVYDCCQAVKQQQEQLIRETMMPGPQLTIRNFAVAISIQAAIFS